MQNHSKQKVKPARLNRCAWLILLTTVTVVLGLAPDLGATVNGQYDTTTLGNWRTAASLETDSEYGTDGYVIYALHAPDGDWKSPYDASTLFGSASPGASHDSIISLPSYISDISLAGTTGRWKGNGNFGQIQDPTAGNALSYTPVLAWGGEPYVFTITRATSNAFRLTILLTDGDGVDEIWTTTVDAGTAGSDTITGIANGVNNTTYHVFEIGSGTDNISVSVTTAVNGWGAITGFAFDSTASPGATIPVPNIGQNNVYPMQLLSWTPDSNADTQKVYFGDNTNDLHLIETLAGGANSCQPQPYPMGTATEYFWRVDTIIGGEPYTGTTWSFTTIAPASVNLHFDEFIDLLDLYHFSQQWLHDDCINNNWCQGADFNFSNQVDLFDYTFLAEYWMDSFPTDIIFDFETGDLQDWRIVEGSFGMFVCDRDTFHNGGATYNKQGIFFLSSLETLSYTPNDGYTGTAESPVFKLTQPEISFLVGGGNNSSTNYIALCTVDQDLNEEEVLWAYGADTEVMQRINWNVPELVGQTVFVRLLDHAIGGWGHVTFDDFSAFGIFDDELTARRWANLPLPIDIDATRQVVVDLMNTYPVEKYDGQSYLDQLDTYEQQLVDMLIALEQGSATQEQLDQLIAQIEDYLRQVLIANPLVSGQPILFVARDQYSPDHHNTHTFFPSYDNEMNNGAFKTGAALKTVDLGNGGLVTTLVNVPNGIVRDPDVYFDGSKIVFSKRDSWSDNFNIYEINADGTGLTQLTSVTRVSDLDPIYMPDDSIVFASSREPKYVHCNRHLMCNIYRMEANGANIHQISKNTLFDFQPSLTPDGRIIYARWEYVDRNFGDAESLWTCNLDGTNHAVYWGNNTVSPGAVVDPRIIPGTDMMICIFSSCHDRPWGALAVVDRRLGVDLPQPNKSNPVQYIWPEGTINLCGGWDGTTPVPTPYEGKYGFDNTVSISPKYEDPYPLYDPNYPLTTGKYFLCSRMTGSGEQMGIYLLDIFGNEILLHVEGNGCYDPMPVGPRPRPAMRPTLRNYNENGTGKFYVYNVYEGTHMAGVQPGTIKSLRVLEATEKRTWTSPAWPGQGQEAPGMAWHDFYGKRILGTVPVETDGSAYFEVPAEKFVYFQLLDENGQMIQSMRSGTLVQSGERIGCVGCHESRTDAPPVPAVGADLPLATQRAPSQLQEWYGPERDFNYLDEVQPVFTNNCVSCHGYDTPGGAEGGLLLEPDKTVYFNTSYNELWRGYNGVSSPYLTLPGGGFAPIMQAYSWGSHASPLVTALDDTNHSGVSLTAEERDRINTWVDINAPYYPVYTSAYPNNAAGRSPLNSTQLSNLTSLTGYSFGAMAPPYLSFDRPEKSLCLSGLSGGTYDQALSIIQAGQSNLAVNPRADMSGHVPNSTDQNRLDKYDMRKIIELLNREAIRDGWENYD
jgi:hypothetical protein